MYISFLVKLKLVAKSFLESAVGGGGGGRVGSGGVEVENFPKSTLL